MGCANASQVAYGFLTPFVGRTRLLGLANLGMSVGSLVTGAVGGYGGFFGARTVTSIASSAQHPVGASLLSHYFPPRRGVVLALNSSIANISSLLAPAAAVVALSVFTAGSVVGPFGFGWLSDRVPRQRVIQTSLVLSAIGTLALAHQDFIQAIVGQAVQPWWSSPNDLVFPLLLLNLLFYGSVTSSRLTLTQALVADSLGDEDRDAAFSLYYFIGFFSDPIWSLVTGGLMENFGFSFAFSRLAFTYVIGMLLLFLVRTPRRMSAEG